MTFSSLRVNDVTSHGPGQKIYFSSKSTQFLNGGVVCIVREFLPRNFRFASWLVKGYDYDYVARTMTFLFSLCSGFISL